MQNYTGLDISVCVSMCVVYMLGPGEGGEGFMDRQTDTETDRWLARKNESH